MSFDNSANLLFTISADPSGAQGAVQQFRSILSKDLSGMKGEFNDWSNGVFGNLSTIGGKFATIASVAAAAGIAIGAALSAAAKKAADYAIEIDRGSDKTGLAAEEMSKLYYIAERTGVGFEGVTSGLTYFARVIDAARDSTSKQAEVFRRLGISQREIEAGSRDMLPLLYRVGDALGNTTPVERAAISHKLFKGGIEDVNEILRRGQDSLREFSSQAERFGYVITEKNIKAAKEWRAEVGYLHSAWDGFVTSAGNKFLPVLNSLATGSEAALAGVWEFFKNGPNPIAMAAAVMRATKAVEQRISLETAELKPGPGIAPPGDDEPAVEKKIQAYDSLSGMLDRVRQSYTALSGEEGKILADTQRLQGEFVKAFQEFSKLVAAGEITGETMLRESQALARIPAAIDELAAEQTRQLTAKRNEEVVLSTEELQSRLDGLAVQTYEARDAAFTREIEQLRRLMASKQTLTAENAALLVQIEAAGRRQIEDERKEAYAATLADLQGHLANIVTSHMTTSERLRFQYDQDLERFSEVEEARSLAVYVGEAKKQTIREQFAINRRAALASYQFDLQTLLNSTGWRGVFTDHFAAGIRRNEALLREWASSGRQSMTILRVAAENLNDSLMRAFGNFAQGMGANIAQAAVYRDSIGAAMQAATVAALQSLAAQAITHALYSTGLGFLRLAQHDYKAAGEAFTAAAVFGSVGTVAAIAGRAMAPQESPVSASGGSGAASASGSGSSAASSGSNGPRVQIVVNGSVFGLSGAEELADILNEAVERRDVRLVATQVRQSGRATR